MSEMRMHVILVVPPGATDGLISHADQSFQPYRENHLDPASRWLVAVTPEAAVHLRHKGGFSLHAPAMRRRLSGMMVRMIHKEGPRSCGWDGEAYEPDETGAVTVPVEAQEDLFSHGFVGAPLVAEKPADPLEHMSVGQPREEVWAVEKANSEGAPVKEKAEAALVAGKPKAEVATKSA